MRTNGETDQTIPFFHWFTVDDARSKSAVILIVPTMMKNDREWSVHSRHVATVENTASGSLQSEWSVHSRHVVTLETDFASTGLPSPYCRGKPAGKILSEIDIIVQMDLNANVTRRALTISIKIGNCFICFLKRLSPSHRQLTNIQEATMIESKVSKAALNLWRRKD